MRTNRAYLGAAPEPTEARGVKARVADQAQAVRDVAAARIDDSLRGLFEDAARAIENVSEALPDSLAARGEEHASRIDPEGIGDSTAVRRAVGSALFDDAMAAQAAYRDAQQTVQALTDAVDTARRPPMPEADLTQRMLAQQHVRMMLDHVPAERIVGAVSTLVEERGLDDHSVRELGSQWGSDYLASRGAQHAAKLVKAQSGPAVDAMTLVDEVSNAVGDLAWVIDSVFAPTDTANPAVQALQAYGQPPRLDAGPAPHVSAGKHAQPIWLDGDGDTAE